MRREALSAALEGGYLSESSLDLLNKFFTIQVEVLEGGRLSNYEVSFMDISLFEFRDEKANRWERIELTEVRIEEWPEGSSTEEWKVWLNFWDAAELSLRCATIRADGEALR
jgi:hypothetical protein